MLTLGNTQLQTMGTKEAHRFYDALRADLRDFIARDVPDIPTAEVASQIEHVFQLCHHYRMHSEAEITRLSFILVTFPPEFYFAPDYLWLHEILSSPAPASARLDRVAAILRAG